MRVLHVAHGWPPAQEGGTERYAAALAQAQAALGARTARFCPADVVGAPPARGFRGSWAWEGAEQAFVATLGRFAPDVVHLHHLTGLSLGLGALARERGARVVLTLHDAWLRCARGQLVDLDRRPCPGPEVDRCARCLSPALWAPVPAALARRLPRLRKPVRARAAAVDALLASVDRVFSPSPHLGPTLGIPAEVIPLPLLRPVAPAPPVPPGPVRFLYAGALIPTKGPDLAVDAFAALPAGAATLTLAGPALPWNGGRAWADALLARMAALPHARWLGALSPEALDTAYAEADVLLFPSTWMENSPFVLREAAAAGLRVVAADVPGARAVTPDARLVPPGDAAAWRAALAAEIRLGHLRRAPATFPALDAHAALLLERYRAPGPGREARPAAPG